MMQAIVESNPADFSDIPALLALLQGAFAYMDGRIDPPSSLDRMDVAALRDKVQAEDLFVIRQDGLPIACMFGTSKGDAYYIGKLAVAPAHRRAGLARALIAQAATLARRQGHRALELQTRVELVENHATFTRLGFRQVAATAHPGFDRPTSLTFRRPV